MQSKFQNYLKATPIWNCMKPMVFEWSPCLPNNKSNEIFILCDIVHYKYSTTSTLQLYGTYVNNFYCKY